MRTVGLIFLGLCAFVFIIEAWDYFNGLNEEEFQKMAVERGCVCKPIKAEKGVK
jgi:hypothetical protein